MRLSPVLVLPLHITQHQFIDLFVVVHIFYFYSVLSYILMCVFSHKKLRYIFFFLVLGFLLLFWVCFVLFSGFFFRLWCFGGFCLFGFVWFGFLVFFLLQAHICVSACANVCSWVQVEHHKS